jgi:hypothetical protein
MAKSSGFKLPPPAAAERHPAASTDQNNRQNTGLETIFQPYL